MNKFIQEELKRCRVADIQQVSATEFYIPKQQTITLEVGGSYLIELEDYIVHPNEHFTLADNWNGGVIPKEHLLMANVIQIMGKMIRVDASSESGDVYFGLWLPMGGIKIKKKLG